MYVAEIMSRKVTLASPDDQLQHVASLMSDANFGAIPVGKNDRLVGMVTDRDITTRGVARRLNLEQCKVSDVMSTDIKFVYEDETLDDVQRNMSKLGIRRLPVLNRDKRLVGIVSLGDMAIARADKAGAVLEKIAKTTRKAAASAKAAANTERSKAR